MACCGYKDFLYALLLLFASLMLVLIVIADTTGVIDAATAQRLELGWLQLSLSCLVLALALVVSALHWRRKWVKHKAARRHFSELKEEEQDINEQAPGTDDSGFITEL